MIHKATQSQIKKYNYLVESEKLIYEEMVDNLPKIEVIFNKLDFKILDNPDGMPFRGFIWKLDWIKGNHSFIFDILYSDKRFAIYITNQSLVPYGEVQHHSSNNIPNLKIKDFTDWLTVDKLDDFLSSLVIIFLKEYL